MNQSRRPGVIGGVLLVLALAGCGEGETGAPAPDAVTGVNDAGGDRGAAEAGSPPVDAEGGAEVADLGPMPEPDAANETGAEAGIAEPGAEAGVAEPGADAVAQADAEDGGDAAADAVAVDASGGACGAEARQVANYFSYTKSYRTAGIAVDGTHLYLALQDLQDPAAGKVVRCPRAGCGEGNRDAATVVPDVHHPRYLVSTGATLFIGAEGSVGSRADGYLLMCPVAGCPAQLFPGATLAYQLMNLAGIDLGGDHLYFGHTVLESAIGRVHLGTRERETIIPAPNYGTIGIATDGTYAYWSQQNGPRTIYRVHAATKTVTPILGDSDGGGHRYGLTYRDGALYWVGTFSNDVWRMDTDGQNLRKLAEGQSQPYAVTVSPTHVTWFNRIGAYGIMTTPIGATPAVPPRELARSMGQPTAITHVGDCVYWTTEGGAAFTVRH